MAAKRYTTRKHKSTDSYIVWDKARSCPVGKTRMRLEQAEGLAERMNADAGRKGSRERGEVASRVVALRALLRAHGFHPKEAHRLLMGQTEDKIVRDLGKKGKVHDVAPMLKLDAVQQELARRVAAGPSSVRDPGVSKVDRFLEKRMRAFAHGHLRDSAGEIVTDVEKAKAIVLAEARAKGYQLGDRVNDSKKGLTAEERAKIQSEAARQ